MNSGYKIFAKIIVNRISKIADAIVSEAQAGFAI